MRMDEISTLVDFARAHREAVWHTYPKPIRPAKRSAPSALLYLGMPMLVAAILIVWDKQLFKDALAFLLASFFFARGLYQAMLVRHHMQQRNHSERFLDLLVMADLGRHTEPMDGICPRELAEYLWTLAPTAEWRAEMAKAFEAAASEYQTTGFETTTTRDKDEHAHRVAGAHAAPGSMQLLSQVRFVLACVILCMSAYLVMYLRWQSM